MTHPGKKLLFMGGEFGQFIEWKDEEQLDWLLLEYESHEKMAYYFRTLQDFYSQTSSLWRLDHVQEGFEWIDPNNSEQSIITFMRKGKRKGDYCIVVCNFSAQAHAHYQIGVPSQGKYIEVFSSDSAAFGGSGQINEEPINVKKIPYHNQPYSMEITVPPLGISIFMKQTKKRRGRVTE
jgi:1,4-alpha-glucan branching enzyme